MQTITRLADTESVTPSSDTLDGWVLMTARF